MAEEQIKWTHCDEKKAISLFENPNVELQYKTKTHDWRSTEGLTLLNAKNKFFRYRWKTDANKN